MSDDSVLERSLPLGDPEAARICTKCEELLAARRRGVSVADEVRSAMLCLDQAHASFAAITAERFINPRTLRRQLAAEGTSYRELADEVGHTIAVELLTSTDLSIDEVTRRVGHADAPSFRGCSGDGPEPRQGLAGR